MVLRLFVVCLIGVALMATGLVGFGATRNANAHPGLHPCGSGGGNAPNSPTDPLCPLVANACNDADGCSACVFSPCKFYVHYPQKRCTLWGRLRGCTDDVTDWCYLVFNVDKDDCATFDPSDPNAQGTLMNCEAHCGASSGHPCTP